MITIKNTEVIKTEKTINVTVEYDEIPYRFVATVIELPEVKTYVCNIHFLDKYEVPLKNSLKKRMQDKIREHLENIK